MNDLLRPPLGALFSESWLHRGFGGNEVIITESVNGMKSDDLFLIGRLKHDGVWYAALWDDYGRYLGCHPNDNFDLDFRCGAKLVMLCDIHLPYEAVVLKLTDELKALLDRRVHRPTKTWRRHVVLVSNDSEQWYFAIAENWVDDGVKVERLLAPSTPHHQAIEWPVNQQKIWRYALKYY